MLIEMSSVEFVDLSLFSVFNTYFLVGSGCAPICRHSAADGPGSPSVMSVDTCAFE